jgi:ribonuclease D
MNGRGERLTRIMTEQTVPEPLEAEDQNEGVQWPLAYRLKIPQHQNGTSSEIWWSHRLYRGPENREVKILYCKTKEESERIARKFLDEPLLGFDMEWPWESHSRHTLQEKVSLIQLACEDKIALFHIGAIKGKTTQDLIAPSLRKIIENEDIAKCGVGVLNADFSRLAQHFKINPRGAFEISHLHRLVSYGALDPKLVTTRLVALARIVEEQLGFPLYKGKVRISDWSKPLNWEQRQYAAADAYAGFMAFQCMNAQRVNMRPVPPLPSLAETYLPMRQGGVPAMNVRLGSADENGNVLTVAEFFDSKKKDAVTSDVTEGADVTTEEQGAQPAEGTDVPVTKTKKKAPAKPKIVGQPLDDVSEEIYCQLVQRRKILATSENVPAYRIATNSVLKGLASQRPADDAALLKVKGIGKVQQEKYGSQWLEVVRMAVDLSALLPGTEDSAPAVSAAVKIDSANSKSLENPQPPMTPKGRRRPRSGGHSTKPEESPFSSPAFGSPLQRTPQLHTGLSFSLAETKLDALEAAATELPESSGHDSDIFTTPPSRTASQRKRKRAESPCKGYILTPVPMVTVPPVPLDPSLRIFRNKLLAFSKRVSTRLKLASTEPLVSDRTLDWIVATPPRTADQLAQVPDIDRFLSACIVVDMNLLNNIIKFAPTK